MEKIIKFKIDGKQCMTKEGQYLVDAAKENGIYVPTLCNMPGIKPKSSCRVCTVKVNKRLMTACSTIVFDGMDVQNNTEELKSLRTSIIELLFVEGNHFCPSCEKSGHCDLQALGYRYNMMVPRFKYNFPQREVDAENPKLIVDQNRCILCKRCIRLIKDENKRNIFAFKDRGHHLSIQIDHKLAKNISDEQAQEAMDNCPVGAILKKGKGFAVPIGKRKYDKFMIGSEIENLITNGQKNKSHE